MEENINLEKEAQKNPRLIWEIKYNNSQSGLNDKYTQKEESNNRIKQLDLIQLEGRNLFEKKNKDYGDAFATYGPVGVLVRIGDKIQRFQNINSKGINLIDDENLRDTLIF